MGAGWLRWWRQRPRAEGGYVTMDEALVLGDVAKNGGYVVPEWMKSRLQQMFKERGMALYGKTVIIDDWRRTVGKEKRWEEMTLDEARCFFEEAKRIIEEQRRRLANNVLLVDGRVYDHDRVRQLEDKAKVLDATNADQTRRLGDLCHLLEQTREARDVHYRNYTHHRAEVGRLEAERTMLRESIATHERGSRLMQETLEKLADVVGAAPGQSVIDVAQVKMDRMRNLADQCDRLEEVADAAKEYAEGAKAVLLDVRKAAGMETEDGVSLSKHVAALKRDAERYYAGTPSPQRATRLAVARVVSVLQDTKKLMGGHGFPVDAARHLDRVTIRFTHPAFFSADQWTFDAPPDVFNVGEMLYLEAVKP